MISKSNNQYFSEKDYAKCLRCKSSIIIDSKILDAHSTFIPLDLNHKRHICSGAERILHEEKVVKKIQSIIKKANDIELASFELRLVI
jgi:hypothetical protein